MVALATPAVAADRIVSAEVTGASSTVWNTTVDGYYTLFLQNPGLGDFLNPNDEAISFEPMGGLNRVLLAGDGWVIGGTQDSDPIYNLKLSFASGNTITGSYSSATNTFLGGTNFDFDGNNYALQEFSFRRYLGDAVSQNVATPGGDGNDYSGNFRLNVSTLAGVPEPATWALMILGFGAVGSAMRRRQSAAAKVRFA